MDEFRIPTPAPVSTIKIAELNSPIEVIRIEHDGRILWRGREVETDEDFRSAMLDLRAMLCEQKI